VKYNSTTPDAFPVGNLEHPAYSCGLAPIGHHLLAPPKAHLGSHKFLSGDDVKAAEIWWLKFQDTYCYQEAIEKLVPLYDKCLNGGGGGGVDNVEK
jgi:hypothetical protein